MLQRETEGSKNSANMNGFKSYFRINDQNAQNDQINNLMTLSSLSSQNEKYHYFCKKCSNFPKIKFLDEQGKIEIFCENHNYKKDVPIKEAPNELVYDNYNTDIIINLNKCKEHEKIKIDYYCFICKKTLCEDCFPICEEKGHNNKNIKDFSEDKLTRINKIIKKIENSEQYKKYNLINHEIVITKDKIDILKNNNHTIKLVKDGNNSNIKKEIHKDSVSPITSLDTKNIDKTEDSNEKYIFNLFKIIFNDYKHYTNYIHIENIDNIDNFFNSHYNIVKKTELILKYKIFDDKIEKIKLFGKNFIENNKDICYIVINNGKNKELSEYFYLNNINKEKEKEIIVKLIKKDDKTLTDMSYIFHECTFLISLEDISNWKTNNVTNFSHAFHGCTSLDKLPKKISQWNTSKVKDMSYLFYFCSSLNKIPDGLKEWDYSKVENMDYMFYGCGIISMPEINTSNAKSKNNIFFDNIKVKFKSTNASEDILLPLNSTLQEVLEVFIRKSNKIINDDEIIKFLFGSKSIDADTNNLKKPISEFKIKEDQIIQITFNKS